MQLKQPTELHFHLVSKGSEGLNTALTIKALSDGHKNKLLFIPIMQAEITKVI